MELPDGFVTISGRKSWRLDSLFLGSYGLFKPTRSEVCHRQNGPVRGVLVEGNRVFNQRDCLVLIAECRIWAIRISARRLTKRFRPSGSECGRLLEIGGGLGTRLHDPEFSPAAQK